MTKAWSNLWGLLFDNMENNDDEELSKDSKLLLDGGVVDLFIKCKKKFPDNSGLHYHMVGTFEAIVAVKELRSRLMFENFLVSIHNLINTEEFTRIGHNCPLICFSPI